MMTVITTNNASPRIRGFLASVMLEIAPAVYISPKMNERVRTSVWLHLEEWYPYEDKAAIVMIWREPKAIGKLGVRTLGTPKLSLLELDGLLVTFREVK